MPKPPPLEPVHSKDVPIHPVQSLYPEPFFSLMKGRSKQRLGDFFGLKNFGVNMTTLQPGSRSALLHRHSHQDELIFVLEGHPTLVTSEAQYELSPGMCIGFPAGGIAHHLINKSSDLVRYLEVGDRDPRDCAEYPNDDIKAEYQAETKSWLFSHKNGEPY